MFQVKCIKKYRDYKGKIIGYKLQDSCGAIRDVSASELKQAIYSKEIYVENLKLTADWRLVDNKHRNTESGIAGDKLSNLMAKSNLMGMCINIRDIFSDIPYKDGNIEKLELDMVGFNADLYEVYFDFYYDYSCSRGVSTEELIKKLDKSIYKNIISFNKHWKQFETIETNNSARESLGKGIVTLKLSEGQFWELLYNTDSFFKKRKIENSDTVKIKVDKRRTNIGVVTCYSIDIIVNGYISIPVITAARNMGVFNKECSDCKLYYKKILPFISQFRQ